jgi:hypothetical protein
MIAIKPIYDVPCCTEICFLKIDYFKNGVSCSADEALTRKEKFKDWKEKV